MKLQFTAYGVPQPKGSAKAFGFLLKDGAGRQITDGRGAPMIRTIVTSANPKNKGWQQLVAEAASSAINASLLDPVPFSVLRGPVYFSCVFYLPRTKSIRRRDVPHISRPDLDKLGRAAGDALKQIAWADDGQVVRMVIEKRYAEPEGVPRAEILVEEWVQTAVY